MQRLVYVLQFHRPPGAELALADGLQLVTTLEAGSVTATLTAIPGAQATLAVEPTVGPDGMAFFETGTVVFGPPGSASLTFASIGTGTLLGPPAADGFSAGTVMWRVLSGTGALAGAEGAITSNFLVDLGTDELYDNHLAVLQLPDRGAA